MMGSSKYYKKNKEIFDMVDYYLIVGKRSNGKTTDCLNTILEEHVKGNYLVSGAYVRRWEVDYKGSKAKDLWSAIVSMGWIEEKTNGKYNNVFYQSEKWYLCRYDKETGKKVEQESIPILFAFNLAGSEHYKSLSYPTIKYILFDEFLTREYYLPDEFVIFQNLLSTIIRDKNDVKIMMCANTVNMYSPYFKEMGLKNITKQAQGTIDIYTYGDSDLKVAVEYCKDNTNKKSKTGERYFAFDNPKLKMITTGVWEINIYPHLPAKYIQDDILYQFYIIFDSQTLQCEIIDTHNCEYPFIYIHRKTTPIKENEEEIIFSDTKSPSLIHRRLIDRPLDEIGKTIYRFFQAEKVFYQDNEVGELVRNYMIWCSKE